MSTSKGCMHWMEEPWNRAVKTVRCPYGNCDVDVCLIDGLIKGSFGPVGCPCDMTPGWRANRLEQMGKPHPPVKAKGRHKGRILRSRRRHDMSEWNRTVAEIDADVREEPLVSARMPASGTEGIFEQLCQDIGFVPEVHASV